MIRGALKALSQKCVEKDRRFEDMGSDKRPIIKLRSTAGTGYTYVTTKNKTNTRERIELKKYDRVVRKHVLFKEER